VPLTTGSAAILWGTRQGSARPVFGGPAWWV